MHPRITLSASNFFFGFSVAISLYVFLPYLSGFMSAPAVGFVAALGSTISILIFFFALPKLVVHIGAQRSAILIAIVQMLIFSALVVKQNIFAAIPLVALAIALQPFLTYTLDILLQATIKERKTTGRVRTMFLSTWSISKLAAPLTLGVLLNTGDAYGRIFLAAAIALVPVIIILAIHTLPTGEPPRLVHPKKTILAILHNRDLTAVFTGHLILYLFFIWAPYYIPLYLHTVLYIPWSTLGWVFTIVLLPFLLLEYPAGFIADNYLGDKKLMVLGFIIMGGSFAAFAFITKSSSIALIVTILLLTRIGAALVEAMTETHFFRIVPRTDIGTISLYRSIWPISGIAAPLIGSILLFISGFSLLFLVTGIGIVITGTIAALSIKDFR